MSPEETLLSLIYLSNELGREDRKLAILGEGNTSANFSEETFLVKASGCSLATLEEQELTECFVDSLIRLLYVSDLSDESINKALMDSRASEDALKPSFEAVFHAYLLSLPGVDFVGHTHPVAVNTLLCSKHAKTFAAHRIFPDEVVCCGPESVFVPYTDPGLKLAQQIRRHVEEFIERTSRTPRLILLENHGMIAVGPTAEGVIATTLMAVKAAEIFAGAAAIAETPQFLTPEQIERIAGRLDEHYRQKALGLE